MTRSEGRRGDRSQRSGPPAVERDLTAELEDEMLASGRGHVMPREGLAGAHAERREGLGRGLEDGAAEAQTHEVEEQLYQDQKALESLDGVTTDPVAPRQRAAAWLREHKGALVIAGCGLLLAAVGLTTARYVTR